MKAERKITIVKDIPVTDYVLEIIAEFNKGYRRITLYAIGDNVCKLANVVSSVKNRIGEGVRIAGWKIGSKRRMGERHTFLEITLEYGV
ncbi:MAG: hypothetical protein GSR72_01720 [Desulfurococcales archaeon]|nr:hypothetical protein [Desulfurococcales archaeon]MEB3788593.1 hypothetical protein [Desulfurococcales archaeon]